MSEKFLYLLLLLIIIIFVSQAFYLILSLPIIEGAEETCLPSCDSVTYDTVKNEIPPCSPMKIELLKPADAISLGIPIIQNFKNSMDNYINGTYNFNTLILPLNNTNINLPTGTINMSQFMMNAYFGDISGIHFKSNQDILDNMADLSQYDLKKLIDDFRYSADITKPTAITKSNIKTNIENYKTDSRLTVPGYASIYTQFLQDMSGMCIKLDNRCPGHYTEDTLKRMIIDEINTPKYYGQTSSFHKVSEYIYQAINGTLGTTTT